MYQRLCRRLALGSRIVFAQQSRTSPPFFRTTTKRKMGQGVCVQDDTIININPANGQEISRVAVTPLGDLDGIVETAKMAQSSWSRLSAQQRINMLKEGLKVLAEKSPQVETLIVREMGKPITEAREEMEGAVDKNDYLNILEQSLQPVQHGRSSVVIRQALGVVVVLSPWNFPCDEILLLVLPALGSGNTVVVKPSEVAPETGALTVNSLASTLPDGVLQLTQGDGSVGASLVAHKDVSMIAMTGSSETGKKILESAAPDMKRFVLELGGKDPMVVFDDAQLIKAAEDAVEYSLSNSGQVCCSIERVLVADKIYDTFLDATKQAAAEYKVGDGMEETTSVGPLVSQFQRDKVDEQVKDAIQKGAKLVYQSDVPDDSAGNYFPVTVLADVTEDMKLYREETFGPVVCISKFDGSEEKAVSLANDTEYGLGGSVYTEDPEKATRVAQQIEAGQVGVNCYALDNMDVACPWVGHKKSGFGYHSGVEGFHNFSIPKTLVFSGAAPKNMAS